MKILEFGVKRDLNLKVISATFSCGILDKLFHLLKQFPHLENIFFEVKKKVSHRFVATIK